MLSRLLAVVVVALSSAYAQSSVAGRLQDLDYITNQLPKLHPNFFFQLDPGQFQQASNGLRSNVSTLTDAQFYVGLAQLVSMAGDVHTSLYLTGSAASSMGFRQFPLTKVFRRAGCGKSARPVRRGAGESQPLLLTALLYWP